MSLFSDFETTFFYFNPSNDNTNDRLNYPEESDGTIDLFIIQFNSDEVNFSGEEVIEFEANADGNVVGTILKGAIIADNTTRVSATEKYEVVEKPHYLQLMDKTKIKLKRAL